MRFCISLLFIYCFDTKGIPDNWFAFLFFSGNPLPFLFYLSTFSNRKGNRINPEIVLEFFKIGNSAYFFTI